MKSFVCISCPVGCQLSVDDSDQADIKVTGNSCKIGVTYGKQEVLDPRRVVTTSVPITYQGEQVMVSLKTVPDVPKGRMFEVLAVMKALTLTADDAVVGRIVCKDVLGLGADIAVTRGYTLTGVYPLTQ